MICVPEKENDTQHRLEDEVLELESLQGAAMDEVDFCQTESVGTASSFRLYKTLKVRVLQNNPYGEELFMDWGNIYY